MDTFFALLAVVGSMVFAVWAGRRIRRQREEASLGFSMSGGSFPPGTRAFESQMSIRLIADLIRTREQERVGADEERREVLERQIANLRKQAAAHQGIVEARDLSPGRMSIGANPDSDRID